MKFSSAVQFLPVASLLSISLGLGSAADVWAHPQSVGSPETGPASTARIGALSDVAKREATSTEQDQNDDEQVSRASRKLAPRSLENVLRKLPQPPPLLPPPATPTKAAAEASQPTDKSAEKSNSSCPPSDASTTTSADDELGAQEASFGFTQARVSQFVKPNFYTLRLKMDPNKPKFSGQLMISLDLSDDQAANETAANASSSGVRYLTLHSGSNINIKKAFYVFGARNGQIRATKIGRNLDRELLTLDFHPNSIPTPSQGLLLLVYHGFVNQTDSHGLFVHRQSAGGVNAAAAGLATHMEPGFARRLFPGWDEPHLKARFNLIVVLPFRGYETVSNMPVKRKSVSLSCSGEPLQEVEFMTTPTMSTYLLTLVVGHFEFIESITPNNCKIRAYFYANQTVAAAASQPASASSAPSVSTAAKEHTNQRRQAAQMALDFAVRTFDYLEGLLGVKYPLSKFDMIALRDFHSGGMENWGAALFHENYLLCDNSSSNVNIRVNGGATRPKRLVVPLVVAHEIVHQWFGNLLTSRTWTYLWLNEGFAQLFMYEVAQALFPAEDYWHIFLEDNRKSAMLDDELITSSHALEMADADLLSQEDQLSLFDQLTYNKGAVLLRMVQFALGPREFMAGLRHYLLKHSYESVVSHDLWAALEESSTGRLQDKQLESVMAAWLSQEGLPVVSVRVSSSPEQADYKLELRQERFTLLPAQASFWPDAAGLSANGSSAQQQAHPWSNWLWSIPVTISSELQPQPSEQELRLWPALGGQASPVSPVAYLFKDKTATVRLAKSLVGDWFKLNYNAIGYFRVNYETAPAAEVGDGQPIDLLARMQPAVRSGLLGPFERYNIVEDMFAMVLSGRRPLVQYLRFLQETFDQEEEPLVLRFIFESLERTKLAIISNAPARGQRRNQLERSFDRYVQRFVRKLIGAFKTRQRQQRQQPMTHQRRHLSAAEDVDWRPSSGRRKGVPFLSLNWRQQRQEQLATGRRRARRARHNKRSGNHNSNSEELLELLDAVRLTYSRGARGDNQSSSNGGDDEPTDDDVHDDERLLWAAHLFARHFRQSAAQTGPPTTGQRSPLDLMGRELRASIYSAALNHKQQLLDDLQAAATDPAAVSPPPPPPPPSSPGPETQPATANELRAYVTSTTNNLELMRQQLRPLATSGSPDAKSEDVVFARLLFAYENNPKALQSAASSERAAIAQALGSTRNLTKQIYLLNLTLSQGFFRGPDAGPLLDAMSQTSSGRRLIWLQINEQTLLFKQRQLLSTALKSVSRGLIELQASDAVAQQSPDGLTVEQQLRRLYAIYNTGEHANTLGQSIEWVRINTLWFKRDHDSLAEFLLEADKAAASSPTANQTTTTNIN